MQIGKQQALLNTTERGRNLLARLRRQIGTDATRFGNNRFSKNHMYER